MRMLIVGNTRVVCARLESRSVCVSAFSTPETLGFFLIEWECSRQVKVNWTATLYILIDSLGPLWFALSRKMIK